MIHKVVVKYQHWRNCRICGREGQEFDMLSSRLHVYEESRQDLLQAAHPIKYLIKVVHFIEHEVVE